MTDLTLDEKLNYAKSRAAELEAEKHFYDAAQPFYPLGFSVIHRNPGSLGRDRSGDARPRVGVGCLAPRRLYQRQGR